MLRSIHEARPGGQHKRLRHRLEVASEERAASVGAQELGGAAFAHPWQRQLNLLECELRAELLLSPAQAP